MILSDILEALISSIENRFSLSSLTDAHKVLIKLFRPGFPEPMFRFQGFVSGQDFPFPLHVSGLRALVWVEGCNQEIPVSIFAESTRCPEKIPHNFNIIFFLKNCQRHNEPSLKLEQSLQLKLIQTPVSALLAILHLMVTFPTWVR